MYSLMFKKNVHGQEGSSKTLLPNTWLFRIKRLVYKQLNISVWCVLLWLFFIFFIIKNLDRINSNELCRFINTINIKSSRNDKCLIGACNILPLEKSLVLKKQLSEQYRSSQNKTTSLLESILRWFAIY